MTFNLAARQKPKDISPNWITACSSPSSHNFQLDSLTAARSAGSQPAQQPCCNSPPLNLEKTCPRRLKEGLKKKKRIFRCFIFRGETIDGSCARTSLWSRRARSQAVIDHIYTSIILMRTLQTLLVIAAMLSRIYSTVNRRCAAQSGGRWAYKAPWRVLFARLDSWTAAELGRNWVISNVFLWGPLHQANGRYYKENEEGYELT